MAGDALPPLHGLPLGVKDLTAAAGLPFTRGSPIFRDAVAPADERLVADLRRAGAIVLGKTNTPEFGAGANTRNAVWGATGNPFDPARSAAGSSGGSAVALACGMVPLATGSDTGGSLRNPAAFCGVVGFRPSPGRGAERDARPWLAAAGHQRPDGAHRAGRDAAAGGDGGGRSARPVFPPGSTRRRSPGRRWTSPRCGSR